MSIFSFWSLQRSSFQRPSFHFVFKPSLILRFLFSTEGISTSNEVIAILDTVSPVEEALECIAPHLSRDIVTSVIQEHSNKQLTYRFFIWAMKRKSLSSSASRSLVSELIIKDNDFDLYFKILHDIKESGLRIASDAFFVLIKAYSKKGMAEKAVELFGLMREFDCEPNVFAYNLILHILCQEKVMFLALATFNQMLKCNCSPNVATYSILIDGLCKTGNIKDALTLFDEMTVGGISPNNVTYSIIISGLCQAKRSDDALQLCNTMKLNGIQPCAITYNSILNGFCRLGRFDEAFLLLQSFEKVGYVLGLNGYSCLIDGLFKAKRFHEAHSWYSKMINQNIEPDVMLCTIMIQGLCHQGKVEDAWRLLSEMAEKGLNPDTYCYNAVIKGLCDIGLLDEAQSLQLEISNHDCFPNTSTYTILICGMCRNGLIGDAQHIFDKMEKLGCYPSVTTFNSLIDGFCKAGRLDDAHLLFCKMEIGRKPSLFLRLSQGFDRVLDNVGLQTMVEKMCDSGSILNAYKLLIEVGDNGILPNIKTYNILINGLCKVGNINGALKLLKNMQLKGISPDSVTYGTLIDGFERVDRDEDAFKVFEQMVQSGCTPSFAVYKSLMTWSCRKQKVSMALNLWVRYLRNSGLVDEKLNIVEKYFEKGEITNAISLLLEMESDFRDFDPAPYNIILVGMLQMQRVDEAFGIFTFLKEHNVTVSPPSCVRLISGMCLVGNIELAIDVFLYTLNKGFVLMPGVCNLLLEHVLVSKDGKDNALDLVSRMESSGYDLGVYLHQNTKYLLHCQ